MPAPATEKQRTYKRKEQEKQDEEEEAEEAVVRLKNGVTVVT